MDARTHDHACSHDRAVEPCAPSQPRRSGVRLGALIPAITLSVLGLAVVSPSVAVAAPTALTAVELVEVASVASTVDTTTNVPCNSPVGACGRPVTMTYGAGPQLQLTGFSARGRDYRVLPGTGGENYVETYRVDNPQVSGEKNLIFLAAADASDPFNQVAPSNPVGQTQGDILGNSLVTEGSDNTFANAANVINNNNIERISFMRTRAIITPDPTRAGLTVIERGGNDPFKLAAVTAVNGSGTPTAWLPIVNVPANTWGTIRANVASTVMVKGPGDAQYRPSDRTGPQSLSGVYVSLDDLRGRRGASDLWSVAAPE